MALSDVPLAGVMKSAPTPLSMLNSVFGASVTRRISRGASSSVWSPGLAVVVAESPLTKRSVAVTAVSFGL